MADRRKPTARDLMLSMLVLVIPIVAIVWFQDSGSPDKPEVHSVNWRPTRDKAQRQASFPVLAPESLPNGWRATRATWTRVGHETSAGDRSPRNQWRLGVLTDHDTYIELDQGDKRPSQMVEKVTRHAAAHGSETVDDQRWRRLVTDDDRTRALVHSASKGTTVVTGDTSYAKLRSFAESLRVNRDR